MVESTAGSTVLVTGASSGVGWELTKKLVAQGASVATLSRSPLPESLPGVREYRADLSDFVQLRRALEAIQAKESHFDVIFNNAGVAFADIRRTVRDHDAHFELNTVVPYIIWKELQPLVERSRGKTVVATSSVSLKFARGFDLTLLERPPKAVPVFGAYGRSKLALSLWSQAEAEAAAARNVTLATVCPGATKTKMSGGPAMPWLFKLLMPLVGHSAAEGAARVYEAAYGPRQARPGEFLSERVPVALPHKDLAAQVLARVDQIYRTDYREA